MNKQKEQAEKMISRFKKKDRKTRLDGLVTLLIDFMQEPSEDNKERIKVYVVNILSPSEFIDFFLDNLETLQLNERLQELKDRLKEGE